MSDPAPILVTGATGYVGARLLDTLIQRRVPVRCLTRRPESLRSRVPPTVEITSADVLADVGLEDALRGCRTAVYLIHSMGSGGSFADDDRRAARHFARAAAGAGVERIIYLGGLGSGPDLSEHLASRQEVGRVLGSTGIEVVEFRAGIVIGSGSLSFDAMSALVRRLPVMIAPRWVRTRTQPIGIDDVVAYLAAAVTRSVPGGVYEIGGPDRVSYGGIMLEYARQMGLRRRIIEVPVLTPALSSLWLGLVTPVYARVARAMIDGLRNETVVENDLVRRVIPEVTPAGLEVVIRRAIEDGDYAPSRWSDAASSTGRWRPAHATPLKKQAVDSRWVRIEVSPSQAFAPIQRIGGKNGWYYGDWLWAARGFLDLVFGGAGTRRGRRHPVELAPGDTVDFWRVEAFEEDRLLRLVAEMRLPGTAWLQFRVEPDGTGAVIRQTAFFDPRGIRGWLYWYALSPLHQLVFPGMLRAIAQIAARPEPGHPEMGEDQVQG